MQVEHMLNTYLNAYRNVIPSSVFDESSLHLGHFLQILGYPSGLVDFFRHFLEHQKGGSQRGMIYMSLRSHLDQILFWILVDVHFDAP